MKYTKEQIDKLKEVLYERAVDDNDDICHHAITYINNLEKQLLKNTTENDEKFETIY